MGGFYTDSNLVIPGKRLLSVSASSSEVLDAAAVAPGCSSPKWGFQSSYLTYRIILRKKAC